MAFREEELGWWVFSQLSITVTKCLKQLTKREKALEAAVHDRAARDVRPVLRPHVMAGTHAEAEGRGRDWGLTILLEGTPLVS